MKTEMNVKMSHLEKRFSNPEAFIMFFFYIFSRSGIDLILFVVMVKLVYISWGPVILTSQPSYVSCILIILLSECEVKSVYIYKSVCFQVLASKY